MITVITENGFDSEESVATNNDLLIFIKHYDIEAKKLIPKGHLIQNNKEVIDFKSILDLIVNDKEKT